MEKRRMVRKRRDLHLMRSVIGPKAGLDFSYIRLDLSGALSQDECMFGNLYVDGEEHPLRVIEFLYSSIRGSDAVFTYETSIVTNDATVYLDESNLRKASKVTVEVMSSEEDPDTESCDQLVLEGRVRSYEQPHAPKVGIDRVLDDLRSYTYGKKESDGKLDYEFDWEFIEAFAKRMSQNKGKYEPYNWKKSINIESLKQAMTRHHVEIMKGNYKDEEEELGHITSVACNAMMLWHQLTNHKK